MKSIGCKLPTCMNCTIEDCQWDEEALVVYKNPEYFFDCKKCGYSFPLCPYQELHPSAGGGGWFVCADCAKEEEDEIIFGGGFIEGGFLV